MEQARAVSLLVALLGAGCSEDDPPPPAPSGDPSDVQEHVDDLTRFLAAGSGAAYPEPWVLDRIDFPEGGNMSLVLGRGLHCQGNATPLAPNATGWVDCSVRLAGQPTAHARDRRALELGFDVQRLTLETPVAAVEWRVAVQRTGGAPGVSEGEEAAGNAGKVENPAGGPGTTLQDTGWRTVDLTPRVLDAQARLEPGSDPCDAPDAIEDQQGNQGRAAINVSFIAAFAAATVHVELGPSRPGDAPTAQPVAHRLPPQPHNFTATFPLLGRPQPMWLLLPVELETTAMPPASSGPCGATTVAHELQRWNVTLSLAGADGVARPLPGSVLDVDVYLALA